MVFQSYKFAAFLLCILCIFFLVPKRGRVWVLLGANLLFFASTAPSALIWLLLSILSTYSCALFIEKQNRRWCKRITVFGCAAVNLGMLTVFRYFPVWDKLINLELYHGIRRIRLDIAGDWGLVAPLGISFYTMQALGYLLDVAKGKYSAEKKLVRYAVFVSFFPNITSGPIERGGHFLPQLAKISAATRRQLLDYDRIVTGGIAVLWGFFLKLVVADRTAILVDYLYGIYQNTDSFTMLMAVLFYSVQIYCDFASYSLIASGVAKMMGFELTENFRQPYFAVGIRSFWDRWHISLSSWLKDYVYIPLGGSRKGFLRRNINVLLTFLISGLWHGGAPHFMVWGLMHGIFQVVENTGEKLFGALVDKMPRFVKGVWCLVYGVFTFAAVSCLWIFFRADSMEMALVCLKNLFTRWQGFLYVKEFIFAMGLDRVEFTVAAVGILLVLLADIVSEMKKQELSAWLYRSVLPVRFAVCLFLIGVIFVFGKYGIAYNASDFIYMQF